MGLSVKNAEKPIKRWVKWWAHKGSNLGPLPCEGNALPLSYAPGKLIRPSGDLDLSSTAGIYEGWGQGVKPNPVRPRAFSVRIESGPAIRVFNGLARRQPASVPLPPPW